MKRYQLGYTGIGRWVEKERKAKTNKKDCIKRLFIIETARTIQSHACKITQLCQETHEKMVKAMLVVLTISGRISGDFIIIFAFCELFKMFTIRVYHMIIKT